MKSNTVRALGLTTTLLGVALLLVVHWMVVFWVPTEAEMGVVQRIFYIHVPAAWTTYVAVGIAALASAVFLWLEDERADCAAVAAAEGAMVFGALTLISGPLWARNSWGTYWTWEPRLTFTLLLWFIFLGYFLVRGSVEDPRKGKRFAAVLAIIGALDIPLIHVSVNWFRSLHPEPVVLRQDGPQIDSDMLMTLLTSLLAFTLLFLGLFAVRYVIELATRRQARALPVGDLG